MSDQPRTAILTGRAPGIGDATAWAVARADHGKSILDNEDEAGHLRHCRHL